MKKIFMALVLVLCLALPAAAATRIIEQVSDLEAIKSNFDSGDTIIISGDINLPASVQEGQNCGLYVPENKTLTLQINEGCTLSVEDSSQTVYGIYAKGNLTITGSGSINARSASGAYGVYAKSSTVNICERVHITATGNNNTTAIGVCADGSSIANSSTVNIYANVHIDATIDGAAGGTLHGVEAKAGGTVYIHDSVKISVTGGNHDAYGVYAVGGTGTAQTPPASGTVNILNGNVRSGKLLAEPLSGLFKTPGTIIIYAGKFSDDPSSYLGGDWEKQNIQETPYQYEVISHAKVSFDKPSLDLDITNGTASGDVTVEEFTSSDDKDCLPLETLTVAPETEANGISAVASSADGKITFTVSDNCTSGDYTFLITCYGQCAEDSNKYRAKTEKFTVKVTKTADTPETDTPQIVFESNPVNIPKGSNSDVSVSIQYGTQTLSADITEFSAPTGITVTPKDSAINIAVDADCASGDYTVKVKAKSGTYEASKDLKVTVTEPTPAPAPKPVDNLPGTQTFKDNTVVQGTASPYTSDDKTTAVTEMNNAFGADELAVDSNGNLKVSEETAATAINNTSGGKATSSDILCFPVVKVEAKSTSQQGRLTLLATFVVSGDELTYAKKPDKIRVYKIFDGETSELVKYVESTSEAEDKCFTVLDKDGNKATTIEKGNNYYISVYILDGDTYDLDGNIDRKIIDPIAIDRSTESTDNDSDSGCGSCNSGLTATSLVAFIALMARRRKK